MSTRETEEGGHVPALDGIRGVAILMVLAYHWLAPFGDSPIGAHLVSVTRIGWLGVDLFFVLSGFLITGILLDTRGVDGALRSFYVRRALRIWPLYLLVVSMQTGVALWSDWGPADERADFLVAAPWVWTHATNWYLGDPATTYKNAFGISPFWSLAVEEQFYLVWPLLLWVAPRAWAGRICLSVAIGSWLLRAALLAMGAAPGFTYMATFTRLDTLAVGGWVAAAARDPVMWSRLRMVGTALVVSPIRAVLALAALALVARTLDPQMGPGVGSVQLLVLPLGAAASAWLIVASVNAPLGAPLQVVLSAPWLRWTGRISYGLYLLHVPVMYALKWTLVGAGVVLPRPVVVGLGAGAAVALAQVSWRLWERPWLSLRRLVPRPPSSGVAVGIRGSAAPAIGQVAR